jgi:hypothetical protein
MGRRYVMLKDRMANFERTLLVVAVWAAALLVVGIAVGLAVPSVPLWIWGSVGIVAGLAIGCYSGLGTSTIAVLLRIPAYAVAMLVGSAGT